MALEAIKHNSVPYYDDRSACLPTLPDEIVLNVFELLRFHDLKTIKPVSKRFNRLCKDKRIGIIKKYFELTHKYPSFVTLASRSVAEVSRILQRAGQDKGPLGPLPVVTAGPIREKCDYDRVDLGTIYFSPGEKKVYVCDEEGFLHSEIAIEKYYLGPFEGSIFKIAFFQKDLLIIEFDFFEKPEHLLIGVRWSLQTRRWVRAFCGKCHQYVLDGSRLIYSSQATVFNFPSPRSQIVSKIETYLEKVVAAKNREGIQIWPTERNLYLSTLYSLSNRKLYMLNLDTGREIDLTEALGEEKLPVGFNAESILYLTADFVPDAPSVFDYHVRGNTCSIQELVERKVIFAVPWIAHFYALTNTELISSPKYSVLIKTTREASYSLDKVYIDQVFDKSVQRDVSQEIPSLTGVGFQRVMLLDHYLVATKNLRAHLHVFDLETRKEILSRDSVLGIQLEPEHKWMILQIGYHTLEIWDLSELKQIRSITRPESIYRFKYKNHTLQIIVLRTDTHIEGLVQQEYLYRFNEAEVEHPHPTAPQPSASKKARQET